MEPVTSTLIISGISAIASVVQAWKAAKDLSKEYAEETSSDISGSADLKLPAIEGDAQELAAWEATEESCSGLTLSTSAAAIEEIIDSDLREVMYTAIIQEKENLMKAMLDPANSEQEKDKAVEIASSRICGQLGRIKKLNGGKLPTEELENFSQSFGC